MVFSTWDFKSLNPNGLSSAWGEAKRELGIPCSFHALRHTHASQLIASGVDIATISKRLGHASPAITLSIYAHMFASNDRKAADAIDASLA